MSREYTAIDIHCLLSCTPSFEFTAPFGVTTNDEYLDSHRAPQNRNYGNSVFSFFEPIATRRKRLSVSNGFFFAQEDAHHGFAAPLQAIPFNALTFDQKFNLVSERRCALIDKFSGRSDSIVLSSEAFQNIDIDVLRSVFPTDFFQVSAVCYFRDQVSYLQSSYMQDVRGHMLTESPQDYCATTEIGNYLEFVDLWHGFTVQLTCRPYPTMGGPLGGDVVSDFVNRCLGIPGIIQHGKRLNDSLSRSALAFRLSMNRIIKSKTSHLFDNFDLGRTTNYLLHVADAATSPGRFLLDTETQREIRSRHQDDNYLLAKRYFPDGNLDFPPIPDDDSASNLEISSDEVKRILLEYVIPSMQEGAPEWKWRRHLAKKFELDRVFAKLLSAEPL